MPFLGNLPNASFQSRPTRQEFSGDGSTTVFTLNQTARAEDIIVSVDGVVQEPDGSYTVPNGTALTFDEAPSSTWVRLLGLFHLLQKTEATLSLAVSSAQIIKA
jgi:hypothetical protein